MNQISRPTTASRPYIPISCSRAEAVRVLESLDMQPPSPERVTSWLQPVIRAVTNPPPPAELAERVRAIMLACQHLPAWAFNRDTAAEAVRKFKFWPAASEIYDLVHAEVADDMRRVVNLRATAATLAPQGDARPNPTADEVKSVTAALRGLCAELKARDDVRDKPLLPKNQAPALSRALLNEIYRRDGLVAPSIPEGSPHAS